VEKEMGRLLQRAGAVWLGRFISQYFHFRAISPFSCIQKAPMYVCVIGPTSMRKSKEGKREEW
jgi:hypothetical protein